MWTCHRNERNIKEGQTGNSPSAINSAGGITDFLPALALLIIGLSGLCAATLWPASSPSPQYVVVAPPWSTLGQTFSLVRTARGGVVEAGSWPNIVIAASSSPDFRDALHKAGAWLVLTPTQLRGCFDGTKESSVR